MIVYNITVKINKSIEDEWIKWQKEEHIPDIMASGNFLEYKFYKLLDEDEEGLTYVLQYFATSQEQYQEYINKTAPILREKAVKKWGNKFIAFRTVMQAVD
ncbi:MAG TPA: DUF4286 family protein [Chitinophagaceae bacterium]|nr:DUF4286 family protein [Chitinophagaceae bacterium]